jgi:hypothetical protein
MLFVPNLATGKRVPLDARAPVYFEIDDGNGGAYADPAADFFPALRQGLKANPSAALALLGGIRAVRVSHFSTCTDPNRFNLRGRIDADRAGKLAAACRDVAAELRGQMTRAKANELADRLDAAAGKERP